MNKEHVLTLRCAIIEEARLIFQTKGFEKATVQDVTEKLRIDEQIFSDYFQSMDELLEVVWSES